LGNVDVKLFGSLFDDDVETTANQGLYYKSCNLRRRLFTCYVSPPSNGLLSTDQQTPPDHQLRNPLACAIPQC